MTAIRLVHSLLRTMLVGLRVRRRQVWPFVKGLAMTLVLLLIPGTGAAGFIGIIYLCRYSLWGISFPVVLGLGFWLWYTGHLEQSRLKELKREAEREEAIHPNPYQNQPSTSGW